MLRPFVLSAFVVAISACGGGARVHATDPDGGTSPPSPPAPDCTGKDTPPADDTWTLAVGGLMRTAIVHLPPTYDPSHKLPLILNFHAYASDPLAQKLLTGMNDKADAAGFAVIYPEGTGDPLSFDGGACCGDAATNAVDDIGFTRALLDAAEARLCIDSHRIFATGFSNGGFMSHRIGCELADRVAAVAPDAAVLGVSPCAPARPMPVLYFHGTADMVVPYDGDATNGWPSAPDSFATWAVLDGCSGSPTEIYRQNDAHCSSYDTCNGGATVTLCTIDGGGHTWPGGLDLSGLGYGYTSTNISATDTLWTFFQAHPLP